MGRYLLAGIKENLPFDEDFIIESGIKPRSVKFLSSGGYGVTYTAERIDGSKIIIKQGSGYGVFTQPGADGASNTYNTVVDFKNEHLMSSLASKRTDLVPKTYDLFISKDSANIQSTQLGNLHADNFKKVHLETVGTEEYHSVYYTQEYIDVNPNKVEDIIADAKPVDFGRYIFSLAKGLNDIHNSGVVHKDIKSENIIITKDGNLKIIDFGGAVTSGATFGENATLTKEFAPLDMLDINSHGSFFNFDAPITNKYDV
jgi:serine/threonine protein kinase